MASQALSVTVNNSDGSFRKLQGTPDAVANEVYRLLSEASPPTLNMPPDANLKVTRYESVQPAPQTLAGGFGYQGASTIPPHLTLPPPPSTAAPLAGKGSGRRQTRQPGQHTPPAHMPRQPHAGGVQPLQTLSTADDIGGDWPGQQFGGGERPDRSIQALNPSTRTAIPSQLLPMPEPPSSFEA